MTCLLLWLPPLFCRQGRQGWQTWQCGGVLPRAFNLCWPLRHRASTGLARGCLGWKDKAECQVCPCTAGVTLTSHWWAAGGTMGWGEGTVGTRFPGLYPETWASPASSHLNTLPQSPPVPGPTPSPQPPVIRGTKFQCLHLHLHCQRCHCTDFQSHSSPGHPSHCTLHTVTVLHSVSMGLSTMNTVLSTLRSTLSATVTTHLLPCASDRAASDNATLCCVRVHTCVDPLLIILVGQNCPEG